MSTKVYCVVKHNEEEEPRQEETHAHSKEVHNEHKEQSNIKNGNYLQYIAKHGHHFCKSLAELAVSKLNDTNGHLKYEKVEEILSQSGESLTDGNTTADLYYMTNKIKSRHSAATIKSDSHVVMLAIEYLNDPSDEEVFCDWVDNMNRRNEKIDWNDFL